MDILFQDDHFVVANKPAGISTHANEAGKLGFVEQLSEKLGLKLGVHQRLDAATSGVIAFSKSEQGATRLAKAFELRNVRKIYRAITCGFPNANSGLWQHKLLHRDGITSESENGRLCKAKFRIIKTYGAFALIELELLTGMTHQLRVQCALAGCPILGDKLYGGGDLYPRLCLHAHRLRLLSEPNLPSFETPLPDVMARTSLVEILRPIFQSRLREIQPLLEDEAIRLMAPQHSGIPELILEKLAHTLLVRHLEPETTSRWTADDLQKLIALAQRVFGCVHMAYRVHESPNQSRACRALAREFSQQSDPFCAREHGITYQFDLNGNAIGLYLDQRENRRWILDNAHGQVLNLFAYTCAFSLCAAKSQKVTQTTSIDAASSALNRGRENFSQNDIDLKGHRFIHEDTLKFLNRCAHNGTRFDTIICDPPSFGRSGKIVFSLENQLENLLEACIRVAAPNATLLFSINHRKIHLQKLRNAFKMALQKNHRQALDPEIFVNDNALGPLGVGTDLKTIRCLKIP